jgi:hypothetical protein
MTTQVDGDPIALLEELFEQFTPHQRKFLVARMELSTDAGAAARAGITTEAVRLWRNNSTPFGMVYDAATTAGSSVSARLNKERLHFLAGKCSDILTDFLDQSPTEEQLKNGTAEFVHKKARLALDILKVIATSSPVQRPGKATPKLDKEERTLRLTKGNMDNASRT